ncbi:MAG: hypothetical protein H6779_04150 [Candidatus Nomurabacteria bacterium]|nr:MAG: hypothetical protein H6779_04150 [Candidatus Nomurabacteria bacterium]
MKVFDIPSIWASDSFVFVFIVVVFVIPLGAVIFLRIVKEDFFLEKLAVDRKEIEEDIKKAQDWVIEHGVNFLKGYLNTLNEKLSGTEGIENPNLYEFVVAILVLKKIREELDIIIDIQTKLYRIEGLIKSQEEVGCLGDGNIALEYNKIITGNSNKRGDLAKEYKNISRLYDTISY